MELGFASPPKTIRRTSSSARRSSPSGPASRSGSSPTTSTRGSSDQGHSPFVWSTLGGIAQATETIRVGTGVTCPLIRIHPAIVAQAAATVAAMMPGRFFLGVGTGENLNEHVHGRALAARRERLEMLEEAVDVIRKLWSGDEITHRGEHYTVEQARLYTLPDERPELYVAASKPQAAQLAGRIGDGLISTAPERGARRDVRGGRRRAASRRSG